MDWRFLMQRMEPHPEVLLAHLILFQFSFPAERAKVPDWVLDELIASCRRKPPLKGEEGLCRGTLLSNRQYEDDLREGLRDARPLEVTNWRKYRSVP
jgi:hypothetical protein